MIDRKCTVLTVCRWGRARELSNAIFCVRDFAIAQLSPVYGSHEIDNSEHDRHPNEKPYGNGGPAILN